MNSLHDPLLHSDAWASWLQDSLGDLSSRTLLRNLRPTIPLKSSTKALIHRDDLDAWVHGRAPTVATYLDAPQHANWSASTYPSDVAELTLFSLNDYLGLASHPEVGMGPRSSAVVGGTTTLHRELEHGLADLKGTHDCLLFPTGFAANMAVVTSLCASGNVDIFSDELNHASIVDGARLAVRSGGTNRLYVYRHNDMSHLEQLLLKTKGLVSGSTTGSMSSSGMPGGAVMQGSMQGPTKMLLPGGLQRKRKQLVVTDSLFSMDGDFADLRGLAALRERYGFLLVVDEAHATLVCGERGAGAAEAMGVAHQVDVHVGTLSKAFGSLGGFAATSGPMKQYLLNKGRSFVYSTALPLPVISAASAALKVSSRETWRRAHLWSLVHQLGRLLDVPALSPVVPLVLGHEAAAVEAAGQLLQWGMHVPAIRPPTVPAGSCRLRVSLSAAHSMHEVEQLAAAVKRCGFQLQRLPFLEEQQRQRAGSGAGDNLTMHGSRL